MKAKIAYFLAVFLLLSLALASCGGVPICDSDEEPLSQAENEALWEEIGSWNAVTLEEASEVAGFEVVSPAFIPEDFCRYLYINVHDPCVGLPDGVDCDLSIQVTQMWAWLEDESVDPSQTVSLILIQTTESLGEGDMPTEVGDHPATKNYLSVEGCLAEVWLFWEIDGMYFLLTGAITAPITEEVLYEVAASVEYD